MFPKRLEATKINAYCVWCLGSATVWCILLIVTALDATNNTATSYSGLVHFTSTDGAGVLPANTTLSNGTRTFSATLNTGGTRTITATDTVTSSITGTSGSITVWQLLHDGSVRCCARRSRMEAGIAPGLVSSVVFTPGGGGGMASPKILFSSHFPRSTGDVRSG